MKPKSSAPPTAEEKRHIERVAKLPCLACGRSLVTVHHVTASIHGGRISRSHQRVVPLCAAHHQHDHGKLSVERLGHAGFYAAHGIDLLSEAGKLWEASQEPRTEAKGHPNVSE
jgi:hypothetical protein